MTLEDFGKLWIASSDLTHHPAQARQFLEYGADTIVLKTALRNPTKKGKNYVVKNAIIIYYDFSSHHILERLIRSIPPFLEDATDGGFLAGFQVRPEDGSLSSYSQGGDPRLLSIEESNALCRDIKREFPHKHLVQSLGISSEDDFELVDKLEGDAVELNLRYYGKFQRSPILLLNNSVLAEIFGIDEEQELFERNKQEVYAMTQRYASSRAKQKPVLLKLEGRADIMDYGRYAALDFDGFTCCDSGRNVITNRDLKFGFRLINKGKTSGKYLLPSSLHVMNAVKARNPSAYISISGGVMTPYNARFALDRGADSVQLCSALYLSGSPIIRAFAEMLHYK